MPSWTGHAGTSDWQNSDNWGGASPPQDGDDVTIPGLSAHDTPTPLAPNGFQAGNLTVQGLGLRGGPVSVTGTFAWSGGALQCDVDVQAGGSITSSPGAVDPPGVIRGSTLTLHGAVRCAGGQPLGLTEGAVLINNGTLTLDNTGFTHGSGAFVKVQNPGELHCSGTSRITGGVVDAFNTGSLTVAAGGRLIIGGGGYLHCAGGTLTGRGRLTVGDGGGGEIIIEVPTAAAQDLTVELAAGGAITPPQGTPILVAPALSVAGPFAHTGGVLVTRMTLEQTAVATVTGTTPASPPDIAGGLVENSGTIRVGAGTTWGISGSAAVTNHGRIELRGTARIISYYGGSGRIDNRGLIHKADAGAATLDGQQVHSTGNIAVNGGTLQLIDGSELHIEAGTLLLNGGDLDSPDNSGTVTTSGGTAGGVLTGTGTVGVLTVNDGWTEPSARGLRFTRGLRQGDTGNLLVGSNPWTVAGSPPPVTVRGGAQLAGSLWATEWRTP